MDDGDALVFDEPDEKVRESIHRVATAKPDEMGRLAKTLVYAREWPFGRVKRYLSDQGGADQSEDHRAIRLIDCGEFQSVSGKRQLYRLESIGQVAMFFSVNGGAARWELSCLAEETTQTERLIRKTR